MYILNLVACSSSAAAPRPGRTRPHAESNRAGRVVGARVGILVGLNLIINSEHAMADAEQTSLARGTPASAGVPSGRCSAELKRRAFLGSMLLVMVAGGVAWLIIPEDSFCTQIQTLPHS